MDYKNIAVKNEQKLKQKLERLEILLYNIGTYVAELDNECKEAEHSKMCFGMTEEEHNKYILGE